jgi:hypothetical protein
MSVSHVSSSNQTIRDFSAIKIVIIMEILDLLTQEEVLFNPLEPKLV